MLNNIQFLQTIKQWSYFNKLFVCQLYQTLLYRPKYFLYLQQLLLWIRQKRFNLKWSMKICCFNKENLIFLVGLVEHLFAPFLQTVKQARFATVRLINLFLISRHFLELDVETLNNIYQKLIAIKQSIFTCVGCH